MSAQYLSLVRKQPSKTPPNERLNVIKKPDYVVYRHKIAHGPNVGQTESSADELEIVVEPEGAVESSPGFFARISQRIPILSRANREEPETQKERTPKKKRKSKKKAKPEIVLPPEGDCGKETDLQMYLPRRPGPFFKVVIMISIVIMLFVIYGNSTGAPSFAEHLKIPKF
jgi:hypothetical protein